MDVQEEVKLVEKELVERIIAHLQANKIAAETARQQAKDFLSLLPVQDQKDLLAKLKSLGEKYEEAKAVYAEEVGKISEAARLQTLDQMRGFIQSGNIDAAIAAAKAMYPPKEQKAEGSMKEAPVQLPVNQQPVRPAVIPVQVPGQQDMPKESVQSALAVSPAQVLPEQKGGN